VIAPTAFCIRCSDGGHITPRTRRTRELGRHEREAGRFIAHGDVAVEHNVAGAAPDRSINHRDHRSQERTDCAHELLQRIVPSQRVPPLRRKLMKIVSRGPHRMPGDRAQDRPLRRRAHASKRLDRLSNQFRTQCVAVRVIVERHDPDAVGHARLDQCHRCDFRRRAGRQRGQIHPPPAISPLINATCDDMGGPKGSPELQRTDLFPFKKRKSRKGESSCLPLVQTA